MVASSMSTFASRAAPRRCGSRSARSDLRRSSSRLGHPGTHSGGFSMRPATGSAGRWLGRRPSPTSHPPSDSICRGSSGLLGTRYESNASSPAGRQRDSRRQTSSSSRGRRLDTGRRSNGGTAEQPAGSSRRRRETRLAGWASPGHRSGFATRGHGGAPAPTAGTCRSPGDSSSPPPPFFDTSPFTSSAISSSTTTPRRFGRRSTPLSRTGGSPRTGYASTDTSSTDTSLREHCFRSCRMMRLAWHVPTRARPGARTTNLTIAVGLAVRLRL